MKRILVTGANKGIGFACVQRLLRDFPDTYVFLGSRDFDRGKSAVDSLLSENMAWTDRVELLQFDTSSCESVAAAAESLRSRLGDEVQPLYGVLNNAGIGFGFDLATTLNTNVMGPKYVTDSFVDMIADGGRIVNVASASGPMFVAKCDTSRQSFFSNPDVTWGDIDGIMKECLSLEQSSGDFAKSGLGEGQAYGFSKACLNLYTMLSARAHPRLRINSCTPGYIATDLVSAFASTMGKTAVEMGAKADISEGTHSPVFLLMGDPPGNGCFFGSDALRSPLDKYRAPGDPPYTGN